MKSKRQRSLHKVIRNVYWWYRACGFGTVAAAYHTAVVTIKLVVK